MIIRGQHKAAFGQAVGRNLECSLLTHAKRAFGPRVAAMGESAVRVMVRKAIAQATRYGIAQAYEVSRYLDMMFLLGEDFDADAALPWTREILDREGWTETEKMDRLCEHVASLRDD